MTTSLTLRFESGQLRVRELDVCLESAAGGYLLCVGGMVDHVGLPSRAGVVFSGELRLETGTRPLLGLLQGNARGGPLFLRDFPVPAMVAVPLSHAGLEAVERHRDGRDLELFVDMHAVLFGAGVDGLEHPAAADQARLTVPAGQWARQLEQVDAAASVLVVVAQPLRGGRRADATGYLRQAQRLISDGRYDLAVAESRKVLDVLNEIDPPPPNVSDARQRNKEQRWSMMRRGLTEVVNAAPHGDAVSAAITWSREDAIAVVAAMAGLLQRVENTI